MASFNPDDLKNSPTAQEVYAQPIQTLKDIASASNAVQAITGAGNAAEEAAAAGNYGAAVGHVGRGALAGMVGVADDAMTVAGKVLDPAANALKTLVTGDSTPASQQTPAATPAVTAPPAANSATQAATKPNAAAPVKSETSGDGMSKVPARTTSPMLQNIVRDASGQVVSGQSANLNVSRDKSGTLNITGAPGRKMGDQLVGPDGKPVADWTQTAEYKQAIADRARLDKFFAARDPNVASGLEKIAHAGQMNATAEQTAQAGQMAQKQEEVLTRLQAQVEAEKDPKKQAALGALYQLVKTGKIDIFGAPTKVSETDQFGNKTETTTPPYSKLTGDVISGTAPKAPPTPAVGMIRTSAATGKREKFNGKQWVPE